MKKIILFSAVLLFFACKKDEFELSIDGLTSVSLPSELIGNWRYLYSEGGWGGVKSDSTIVGNVLTIQANQTFKWCKQDVCSTGKWFYGSKSTKSATFLIGGVSSSVSRNTPFELTCNEIATVSRGNHWRTKTSFRRDSFHRNRNGEVLHKVFPPRAKATSAPL